MALPDQGFVYYLRSTVGPTFTVNTAVNYVNWNAIPGNCYFVDPAGNGLFDAGDNFFLESIEACYPYQFGQGPIGDGLLSFGIWLELSWESTGVQSGIVTQIGSGGTWIPDPNVEHKIQVPIYYPATDSNQWQLRLSDGRGTVSMLNVPASLNTETLEVQIMLKVRSTFNIS